MVFLAGNLLTKTDINERFLIVWNSINRYVILKVFGAAPSLVAQNVTMIINASTLSDMEFNPDGSRLVLEFDNLKDLLVYNLSTANPIIIKSMAMSFVIKKILFIDNTIIAVFHDMNITYYLVDTMTVI